MLPAPPLVRASEVRRCAAGATCCVDAASWVGGKGCAVANDGESTSMICVAGKHAGAAAAAPWGWHERTEGAADAPHVPLSAGLGT